VCRNMFRFSVFLSFSGLAGIYSGLCKFSAVINLSFLAQKQKANSIGNCTSFRAVLEDLIAIFLCFQKLLVILFFSILTKKFYLYFLIS